MEKGLIVDLSKPALVEAVLKLRRFCIRASQAKNYDSYVTKYYYRGVIHPTDNLGALLYDDTDQIPIANLKDYDEFGNEIGWNSQAVSAIQDLIDVLGYTENQAKNYLESNSSFGLEDLVNPKLPINGVEIKLKSVMISEGWFPIEEV